MLNAVESWLEALLKTALAADAEVVVAPVAAPPTTTKARINLFVAGLNRDLPLASDEDAAGGRESAYFSQSLSLAQDKAKPLDFALPDGAQGQVAEVQTPAGKLFKPGDAFTVDGRVLRFFSDPGGAIVVGLRAGRSRGYREKAQARINLELAAWATVAATADSLLARGLRSVLGALAEREILDLVGNDAPGLAIRLTKPVARLAALENTTQTLASGDWRRLSARIVVSGELELGLSLGQPEPEGVIQSLALDLAAPKASGALGHTKSLLGGA